MQPTTGNDVRYLEDADEAYPAMLAAIAAAAASVHMEAYIYESDVAGWRFARALARAARRGVMVRLLIDAVGSYRLDARLRRYLVDAGAHVVVFNPLRFTGWELITRRNHRKILIVDRAVAFIGGLNISLDHVPEPLGRGWHDALARIAGPAAIDLDNLFVTLFRKVCGRTQRHGADLAIVARQLSGAPDGRVALLRNGFFDDRYVIRRRYLSAMRQAKKDIAIANAYFLPDRRIVRALRHAALRGVRVRLLLPGLSDVPLIKTAMEAAYERYLRLGLEIREWPGTMLHHKVALFDGRVLCVGSYNLDNVSLRKNLEISAWIDQSPAVDRALAAYERDWDASRAVAPDSVKLTVWRRMVAWLALRLD